MDDSRAATIAGFLGAVAVLAVLVWVVGVDRTLGALFSADPELLVLVLVVATVWLTSWGLALWSVLRALGTPVSPQLAVLVYVGSVFSNNVTPFGQAGGEPLSALLIASATDSEYETGLAAIASVDTAHFMPSVGYAIVGFVFVTAGAVEVGRSLTFAAVAVGVLAVGMPVSAYLGWRYRYRLERAVVRTVTPLIQQIGRFVPRWSPPTAGSIEHRIEGFFDAIERIAGDRRGLLQTLGFSAVGWACLAVSLWLSLAAVGHPVSIAIPLLVVPIGSIASIVPLPGGSGAIETVLVTLILSTSAVPAAAATSAVLIHRGATYLFPTLVGAGVASALGADHAVANVGE